MNRKTKSVIVYCSKCGKPVNKIVVYRGEAMCPGCEAWCKKVDSARGKR